MPKNMSEFLTMMDERLWFRMVVCFLPPLVLVKLIGYADDESFLNKASTAILLIFVALYVFWPKLRGWSRPAEEGDAIDEGLDEGIESITGTSADRVDAHDQVGMLAELRALCQEPERESDRLIAMEVAVNPHLSYAEATRSAIARKRMLVK